MKNINKWIGEGRLTRDAELKYLNSGTALCSFSIAVNSTKKDGDQYVDEPNFFECSLWGKHGEAMTQYLTKGRQVFVEAELRQQRWEQDGQSRSKVVLEVKEIGLGSLPRGAEGGGQGGGGYDQGGQGRGGYDQGQSQGQGRGGQGRGNYQGQGRGAPQGQGQAGRGAPAGDDFHDDIPF